MINTKQKIYIDVTSFSKTKYMTGIQRVVKNVILEFPEETKERLVFLAHTGLRDIFDIYPNSNFIDFLKGKSDIKKSGETIRPSQISAGDIFFDIDSVWNLYYKRSILLPQLKSAGVKIAVFVHDIIPITHPQFCYELTCYNFANYIAAYLQYADIIISSAQSTLDEIAALQKRMGLPITRSASTWLGANFSGGEYDETKVAKEAIAAATGKYILVVGTLEPRKNHAYLMEAFTKGLYDKGVKLIFAGRIGWNVEDLVERIKKDPHYGKEFFFLEGLNDESIDYLYSHAMAMAFPTFQEGFGLPIVEALQKATPVMASDVPVLKEVGGDLCEYFDPHNHDTFIELVSKYLEDEAAYKAWREKLSGYTPVSWAECAKRMAAALNSLEIPLRAPKRGVKQMVFLTAREDAIGETLKFVDHLMPFITDILLCCPDFKKDEMLASYSGRLKIDTLTDSEVLKGRELPKDHSTRNFMLRCLAMESDKLDEVFIMADDDYRPLREVDESQFITEDYYRAYYFYDLQEWPGSSTQVTSFDKCHFKSRDFLAAHHYPSKMYASHQPQVIEKALYQDMVREHPGIEITGMDEWDTYFNYVQYRYPYLIHSEAFVTLTWPAADSDFRKQIFPADYVFENYYEHLYNAGQKFAEFSSVWTDNQLEENKKKIELARSNDERARKNQEELWEYIDKYEAEMLEGFMVTLETEGDSIYLGSPERMRLAYESINHIPFYCHMDCDDLELVYKIYDKSGKLKLNSRPMALHRENFENAGFMNTLVIRTMTENPVPKGKYKLIVEVARKDKIFSTESALEIY